MPETVDRPRVVVASVMRRTGATGVQSHVNSFIDGANGLGRDAELVTPFDTRSPLAFPVFAARRVIHPVSSTSGVWWYRYWHGHYLRAALRHRLSRNDRTVVYCQCPVSAQAALEARVSQPVVLVVHFNVSQADEWAEKGEIASDGRLFDSIRRFEEEVLGSVDGIVYVSEFMRAAVHGRVPASRGVPSLVAPNFVDVGRATTEEPQRDLVTLGSLEPRKNQGFILEVLAAAARRGHIYTLTIIGDGPLRARLQQRARSLGLEAQVFFAGYQADPRPLMRRHRLYCHAARMESFGIALAEAMAEGLPVLAAPVGGVAEVVRPGVDGEVWGLEDPDRAADVLIGLLEDRTRLSTLGDGARLGARTRFSREVVVPRLLGFLDDVGERATID